MLSHHGVVHISSPIHLFVPLSLSQRASTVELGSCIPAYSQAPCLLHLVEHMRQLHSRRPIARQNVVFPVHVQASAVGQSHEARTADRIRAVPQQPTVSPSSVGVPAGSPPSGTPHSGTPNSATPESSNPSGGAPRGGPVAHSRSPHDSALTPSLTPNSTTPGGSRFGAKASSRATTATPSSDVTPPPETPQQQVPLFPMFPFRPARQSTQRRQTLMRTCCPTTVSPKYICKLCDWMSSKLSHAAAPIFHAGSREATV